MAYAVMLLDHLCKRWGDKGGQVLFLVSSSVRQPTDRSIVQPQELRNLSLTVPVTMYRPGNPPIPPGLAEPAPKQTLQLGPS
jgi:hypothetical protein